MCKRLACITCYYNFYDCILQEQNLHNFICHMESFNIPVYGVELLLPGQISTTKQYDTWKQVNGTDKNILWQKEALLNIAESFVPSKYDAIAWIDADIKFDNNSWVEDTLTELEFCDFIQLFKHAFWLDIDGNVIQEASTVVNHNTETWEGHTGFAWGCKRETWKRIGGLYDRCFSGGGDKVMASIFTEKEIMLMYKINTYVGSNIEPFLEWYRGIRNVVTNNIEGSVYHAYHGDIRKRQYGSRKLYTHEIDGFKDIVKNQDGVLEWDINTPQLFTDHFKNYFKSRVD